MENRNSQDLRILKKAQRHVSFSTTFIFLLLILYFVSLFYVNNQVDFLTVNDSFKNTCYMLGAIQLFVFVLLNSLIMKGKKIARVLYWLVFILEVGEYYFPMVAMSEDSANFLTYIALMLMMLLKLAVMGRFGTYLSRNKYAKILFDHVIQMSDYKNEMVEEEEVVEEPQTILDSSDFYNDFYDDDDFVTEKITFREPESSKVIVKAVEEITYPQLAIRLAGAVYGSLAGFPILANVLSDLLCSTDGKVVFAMKDIFMLCILSAVLWTFAILFLYYDHPKSKSLCNYCVIGEIVGLLFYIPKFIGYMKSDVIQYAPRVFILFFVMNAIRYVILAMILKPIYTDGIKPTKSKD